MIAFYKTSSNNNNSSSTTDTSCDTNTKCYISISTTAEPKVKLLPDKRKVPRNRAQTKQQEKSNKPWFLQ